MSIEPRNVTTGAPQIFVDLDDIEDLDNVEHLFHSATRHPANPVLEYDVTRPWERPARGPAASVIYDHEDGHFKCWYQALVGGEGPPEQPGQNTLSYAASEDGVHWTKPHLGLHEVAGTKDHNIVVPPEYHEGQDHWESVLKDTFDPDPARRYKGFGWSSLTKCLHTMTSPDGLNWTHREDPIFEKIGDAQAMMIDTAQKRYVTFLRSGNRLYSVSEDFVHWSKPAVSLRPLPGQSGHATMYNHVGFNYGDQYLGVVSYYHQDKRDPRFPLLDLRLLSSDDGLHYRYPGAKPRSREALVGCGTYGEWDRFMVLLTGAPPVRFGDKLHIYYRGFPCRHAPHGPPNNMDSHLGGGIGLATIRADGFASLAAGFDSGRITTKPIVFDGSTLHINAKANFHAQVVAEVLDAKGKPIAGYTTNDCVPMTVDSVDHAIEWKQAKLAALTGRPIKLRFHLVNTQLYSYWVK